MVYLNCPHCDKQIEITSVTGKIEEEKEQEPIKSEVPEIELPAGITKGNKEGQYFVTGSKGDEYIVNLNDNTCKCPDSSFRHKICKHIKFARDVTGYVIAPITAGENAWFEKVGNEASWEDLEKVMGEKRIKELVEQGEIFNDKPGMYKRLK